VAAVDIDAIRTLRCKRHGDRDQFLVLRRNRSRRNRCLVKGPKSLHRFRRQGFHLFQPGEIFFAIHIFLSVWIAFVSSARVPPASAHWNCTIHADSKGSAGGSELKSHDRWLASESTHWEAKDNFCSSLSTCESPPSKISRNWAMPRAMRDFTVPTGTSRISAMSLYGQSSRYASATASW